MTNCERPKPGELIYVTPECPLCGGNVDCDGTSFWCEPCGVTWGMRPGDEGEFDPDSEQCPMAIEHGGHPVLSGRCVLSESHSGKHNNGKTQWGMDSSGYHRSVGSRFVDVCEPVSS